MDKKFNVGIIGCGNISDAYFEVCKKFDAVEIVACSDINEENAKVKAEKYNISGNYSVDEQLKSDNIEIIINLTHIQAHAEVNLSILEAGKHLYSEKPLTLECDSAKKLIQLAERKGLRIGCAPDTFLGPGLQACRNLIDEGAIGEVVGFNCSMMTRGSESWHPYPENHYKFGGDPMFNMGPYYLTALINLIGPIRNVVCLDRITFPERTITSQPKYGQKIKVEVPTYIAGVMEFENGAHGTITTSYDVWASTMPCFEIYGSKGSLVVPDPNTFGGPVKIWKESRGEWEDIPLVECSGKVGRGIGLMDMIFSLQAGKQHKANGEVAYHVLDVITSLFKAAQTGTKIEVGSTCKKPEALKSTESIGKVS